MTSPKSSKKRGNGVLRKTIRRLYYYNITAANKKQNRPIPNANQPADEYGCCNFDARRSISTIDKFLFAALVYGATRDWYYGNTTQSPYTKSACVFSAIFQKNSDRRRAVEFLYNPTKIPTSRHNLEAAPHKADRRALRGAVLILGFNRYFDCENILLVVPCARQLKLKRHLSVVEIKRGQP